MEEQRRRQAENENRFRSVNEKIEDIGEQLFERPTEEARVWDFVCECHREGCVERIALTVAEYEAVRADGRRFLVVPSPEHVDLSVENVVDMSTRYWVVEKTGESGEVAEATDPRD